MSRKQSVPMPVASLIFWSCWLALSSALHAGAVCADGSVLAATNAAIVLAQPSESLVTLSDLCKLATHRLPDLVPVAQFDGGNCADRAVVRSSSRPSIYVGNRDGQVNLLSLPELKVIRQARVGDVVGHLLATSGDRYLIAATESQNSPGSLLVLHGSSLVVARQVPLKNRQGRDLTVARLVEVVYRQSVLVTFKDSNEMWELFLAPDAEMVFEGMVHDYRMGEGISEPRSLPIRRIAVDGQMDNFFVEPRSPHVWQLKKNGAGNYARRFNLDVRRTVEESTIPANVDPRELVSVSWNDRSLWIAAERDWPGVHIHALTGTKHHAAIDLPGERCRALSPLTGTTWFAAVCGASAADQLFIIDSANFALRAILQPKPGRRVSQLAYGGRDGSVVAVLGGDDGLLVAYAGYFGCRIGEAGVPRLRQIVEPLR